MEEDQIWNQYYQRALARPHAKRTEFAVRLNQSASKIAIDCGCGTGSDIEFLSSQGYQVYGFDINPDAMTICRDRFAGNPLIELSQSSFETYDYPSAGVIIANSSLFFAQPNEFENTWLRIESALEVGGVFAGDFMGYKDSWADNYRSPTSPITEQALRKLLANFEIVRFYERDERAPTTLGKLKQWHTYSVVAVKVG
ncbi:methyltransferase domain-containing protein [Vibrio brasiliensis]|uniref:class I SAM-dependent methyltransferase n=1 Tax=Vibrio brasiliensis TaxID=170652 RepID=UPI001EFDFEC8|nr:class I SAM-dependent methyltransferase [Vibrio brasiliensis]MCG9782961.1 methyltransferase domain-containing protein [Vibrio brasiliensis]